MLVLFFAYWFLFVVFLIYSKELSHIVIWFIHKPSQTLQPVSKLFWDIYLQDSRSRGNISNL